jgi:hypothetical protein
VSPKRGKIQSPICHDRNKEHNEQQFVSLNVDDNTKLGQQNRIRTTPIKSGGYNLRIGNGTNQNTETNSSTTRDTTQLNAGNNTDKMGKIYVFLSK